MIKAIKKGFTLIELLIAMSIFFIMVITTYAPYNYYTKKAKLNNATKEISQSIYSARNLAVNGMIGSGSNSSVGIYFENSDDLKNKLSIYSYPFDLSSSEILAVQNDYVKLIKTITLPDGIQIDLVNDKDNGLLFFNSISGVGEYYYFDPIKNNFTTDEIVINVSYKGSTGINLTKQVIYYTKTNIVDYN